MSRQPQDKINYLYGRLSHEDELTGDSNSIINQRRILEKYAEENGFTPYEFIYDDGYSGADFERPDFSRMIEDVEAGKVATVIVKDMSRLLGLWLQTIIIGFTMKAIGVVIFVIVYGRMLEIYLLSSLAPIPFATLSNRDEVCCKRVRTIITLNQRQPAHS